MPPVILGADRLRRSPEQTLGPYARGGRIGLLTNDGAQVGLQVSNPSGPEPTRTALVEAGVPLVRLFTPEHGLSASAPDGTGIPHGVDPETGLPVFSLYGDDFHPSTEALDGLDLVLVDLQDVGSRFYTYIWTLSHLMESCARAGIGVWVLDRPNPLGGKESWVEGPLPHGDSPPTFLGRWPIPVRHSLTMAELALLLRFEMKLELDLKVVAMEGWRREMLWPGTGLTFTPPSPGIPSHESALLYPGLALLEATNVMEGRGTEFSFRWFGAPWMDSPLMVEALDGAWAPGVKALSHTLTIPGHPEPCPGIRLDVTDPAELRPVALGLRILSHLLILWPNQVTWMPYPTLANPDGDRHLLHLLAHPAVVDTLRTAPQGVDDDTINGWTQAPDWWTRAAPHLLYP